MVGIFEVFVKLYGSSVRILNLNVIPRVDVDFFYSRTEDVFCEERELCHFGVELVNKLFLSKPLDREAVVEKIFPDIPLYLSFDLVIACAYVIDSVNY